MIVTPLHRQKYLEYLPLICEFNLPFQRCYNFVKCYSFDCRDQLVITKLWENVNTLFSVFYYTEYNYMKQLDQLQW